jgi:hypothetical protein
VAPDACGDYDVEGTCMTRPTSCPTACAEVCACGGGTFCNTCQAYAFGLSVAYDGACAPQDPSFRAVRLEGGGPRVALLMSSVERGVCFRVVVAEGQGSSLGIDGGEWSVESVTATHDAADCDVAPGSLSAPVGETASPLSGEGTVAVWEQVGVCVAYLDAKILFGATPPSWLSAEEYVHMPTSPIEGGCP